MLTVQGVKLQVVILLIQKWEIQNFKIPEKGEEDPYKSGLGVVVHQIPYAFAIANQYQAAQSTCLSSQDQFLQLPKTK